MRIARFSVALAVWVSCSASFGQGQLVQKTLQHDGRTRAYRLYVPQGYTGKEAWPLVLNLHGGGSNSSQQMSLSGMNAVADAGHFLVAYPDAVGSPTLWNDGKTLVATDDLGFIKRLLDELESDYHIDSSRIYATGLSNGGAMSYALGREMSDRIAAVASVAGPNDVTASRPLPVLHVHGTSDPIALIGGGPLPPPLDEIVLPAVADVIEGWRESNQCVGEPVVTQLPDLTAQDSSTVELVHYEDCEFYVTSSGEERPAEVLYYRINGGGHTWPGGGAHPAFLGTVNRDINASQEIWNFFSRHELPATMPASLTGDYNQNGTVEQADLDQVLLNWGADALDVSGTWASGLVDQDELDGVLLHWGDSAAKLASTAAAVPEPTTLGLATLSTLTLLRKLLTAYYGECASCAGPNAATRGAPESRRSCRP